MKNGVLWTSTQAATTWPTKKKKKSRISMVRYLKSLEDTTSESQNCHSAKDPRAQQQLTRKTHPKIT